MKRKSKRLFTIIWCFLFLTGLCLQQGRFVTASDKTLVPELTGQKGSLMVGVNYTNEDADSIMVPGTTFRVTKVSDLAVTEGCAEYSWIRPYEACGVNLEGMTIGESIQAAKKLERMLLLGNIAPEAYECRTNENGFCDPLSGLSEGMYLVYDFNHPQTEEGEASLAPYLIQVPNLDPTNPGAWIYDVVSYPKPDVMDKPGDSEEFREGSITVTKKVSYLAGDENVEIVLQDATFYVGLFLDEDGTILYREGGIKPVHLHMGSNASVVFDHLPEGNYYVYETMEDGTPVPTDLAVTSGADIFMCILEEDSSQEVSIAPTIKDRNGNLLLNNCYLELPSNYALVAEVEIGKTVLNQAGEEITTDETFYAGIFTKDSEGSYEVIRTTELEQNGSVRVQVPVGGDEEYWIFETNEEGVPVSSLEDFNYIVSGETSVEVGLGNLEAMVQLTNTAKPLPFPDGYGQNDMAAPVVEEEEEAEQAGNVRTGDETRLAGWLLTIGLSTGVSAVILFMKKKKRKN